jgi:CBS domain-containing protein
MQISTILQSKGTLVVSISRELTILDATRELTRYGIGAIVVCDSPDGIDGILSERDIARAVAAHGADALELKVADVMTTEVTTCAPTDTTDELAEVMTAKRIRHLPVMDDGRIVGVVSIGDIVKHRLDELQVETRTLHEYLYSGR